MNTPPIAEFQGEFRWLSNFWMSTGCHPSVEHQFQAHKAANASGAIWVMSAATPGQAKRRGRQIKLRHDWEDVKLDVMRELVTRKFVDDAALALKLIQTGDAELIEGNTWGDTFWGVCGGRGENHLGKILMDVRKLVA